MARRRLSTLRRLWALALAAVVLVVAWSVAPVRSASAATPSSALCTGYATCSMLPFSNHAYAAHSSTSYWRMYAGNNCTNYVAYVESTVFGVGTPSYLLGNAGQWATNAAAHGVLVDQTPAVGAVADWYGGSAGMGPSGHVAIVEAVGPNDSYILISQQHMVGADGYDWVRIYPVASENQWQDWPNAFIHFAVATTVPSPPPTPGGVGALLRAQSAEVS